jgi:hypothetical protein
MTTSPLDAELDRQIQVLVDLGVPALADRSETELRDLLEPLREPLRAAAPASFAVVVTAALVPVTARLPLLSYGGRPGTLSRHFADVATFAPVVDVPAAPAYAVVGIDRGDEFRSVRPGDAAAVVAERGRTPLTIDEGIAWLLADPAALEKNHCFHTGGSRGTDRRVPAIWISERAPHLGWCWESNHHTWLGYASADGRVSA